MDAGSLIYLLLILACPVAMIFMMKGMHGAHGAHSREKGHSHSEQDGSHACCRSGSDHRQENLSLDDLRARRAELEREISEREYQEGAPVELGR